MSQTAYHEMFPLGADETPYRLITKDHVSTVEVDGLSRKSSGMTISSGSFQRTSRTPGMLRQSFHSTFTPNAAAARVMDRVR